MSLQELIIALKAILADTANKLTGHGESDFQRLLEAAALDFSRVRPRIVQASLTLIADQALYPAPVDLRCFASSSWGLAARRNCKPWEAGYPQTLPHVRVVESGGGRQLALDPPPNNAQILQLGGDYDYYYNAVHSIGATAAQTTIDPKDKSLLLLRATAEAMSNLAIRNHGKPVKLRDGLNMGPRNGTPAALYDQLMEQFEKQAA